MSSPISDHPDHPDDLLAPYALDAVDPHEAAAVRHHLQQCPRCRAEVDGYLETAAALGTMPVVALETPPPAALWDRIAAGLGDRVAEPPDEPQFLRDLRSHRPAVPEAPAGDQPPVDLPAAPVLITAARASHRRQAARWATAAVAVAATVVAVVLGVNLSQTNHQLHQTRDALAAAPAGAQAALQEPGHRVVSLDSPTGAQLAEFVIAPDGRGYMVSSSMPSLSGNHTYQLWGIFGGRPISLGLMGTSPHQATFTVASSATPSALAVTVEPAAGAVAPTETPVASGAVAA